MYTPGQIVSYKMYLGKVRFCLPAYKKNCDYYVITIPSYRGFKMLDKLVRCDEIDEYRQIGLFG